MGKVWVTYASDPVFFSPSFRGWALAGQVARGQSLPSTLRILLHLDLLHLCLHSCHLALPESAARCQSGLITMRIWFSQFKTTPWLPATGGLSPNPA